MCRATVTRVVVFAALLALFPVDGARAQCDATQLCPAGADPCVVAASCTVPGGSVFDLGDRHLIIDRTTLTLALEPLGDAYVAIRAGAMTLTPGARIVAAGGGAEHGPRLTVDVTSDFRMESDGTGSARIDLGGSVFPQFIDVRAGGAVVVNGTIALDAGPRSGVGGGIYLEGVEDVVVDGGGLSARGGDDANLDASGGEVLLRAGGTIRLDAPVDASGGDCGSCSVEIEAEHGDVFVSGDIDVRATDRLVGEGGGVFVVSPGSIRLEGAVRASARGSGGPDEGEGGAGGGLEVEGAIVHLLGDVDLRGAAPDGFGGFAGVFATDRLHVSGRIDVSGPGPLGVGGDILLDAADALSIAGVVDGGGGNFGGLVRIISRGTLTLAGRVSAVAEFGAIGISLEGCEVDVQPGARLDGAVSHPSIDAVEVTASGTMTIAGEVRGPSPANLRFRDRAPIIQPTAVFEQPPTLEQVPGLPCCGACVLCAGLPNGSPCDDGDACTSGEQCSAGVCTPAQSASCGACELCDGAGGCVAAPRPHCRLSSDGGALRLRRAATATRDALIWSWKGSGESSVGDLGNPTADTDVALCLFDDAAPAPALLFRAVAPGGATCGRKPCWRLRSGSSGARGFSYRNASGRPEGVVSSSLATSAGRDRMRLVAKGALLRDRPFGLPALPLATPLRAQLQASDGGCWETRHE